MIHKDMGLKYQLKLKPQDQREQIPDLTRWTLRVPKDQRRRRRWGVKGGSTEQTEVEEDEDEELNFMQEEKEVLKDEQEEKHEKRENTNFKQDE